jgi:hypothetical protein
MIAGYFFNIPSYHLIVGIGSTALRDIPVDHDFPPWVEIYLTVLKLDDIMSNGFTPNHFLGDVCNDACPI